MYPRDGKWLSALQVRRSSQRRGAGENTYSSRNGPRVVSVGTSARDLSEAHSLFQPLLLFLHQAFFLAVHWERPLCFAQRRSITIDPRPELGERAVIEMAFGRHHQSGTFQIQSRSIFNSGIKKDCVALFLNTLILQKVTLRGLEGPPGWQEVWKV